MLLTRPVVTGSNSNFSSIFLYTYFEWCERCGGPHRETIFSLLCVCRPRPLWSRKAYSSQDSACAAVVVFVEIAPERVVNISFIVHSCNYSNQIESDEAITTHNTQITAPCTMCCHALHTAWHATLRTPRPNSASTRSLNK